MIVFMRDPVGKMANLKYFEFISDNSLMKRWGFFSLKKSPPCQVSVCVTACDFVLVYSQQFFNCLLQIIHYYLVDDTVEIREVHTGNDGRDPFPVLVCRQRLPKDRTKVECKYFFFTFKRFYKKLIILSTASERQCSKHQYLCLISPYNFKGK